MPLRADFNRPTVVLDDVVFEIEPATADLGDFCLQFGWVGLVDGLFVYWLDIYRASKSQLTSTSLEMR